MTDDDTKKLTNALAFIYLMMGEDINHKIELPTPNYILGKYYRYCVDASEYEYMWGLHPIVHHHIKYYLAEHSLPFLEPDAWVKEDD